MRLHLNDRVGYRGMSGRHMGLHLKDMVGYSGKTGDTRGYI